MRSTNRSRGPATVYAAASVALLVLIATLAITTASSAPPSIAEYAPHSIQQIKHAPQNQTGNVGNPGGAPAAVAGTTPTPRPSLASPAPAVIRTVPKLFACVGDPPRQTFDPQSPPCIASWSGDNGGATAAGVTRNEVRVYVPPASALDPGSGAEYARIVTDLEAYFNRNFEFYERHLTLDPQASGAGAEPTASATCSDIQAQADWVARQLKVFASLDDEADNCWYDALGRDKVVSVSWQSNENRYEQQQWAPYLWSYPGDNEDLMSAMGEFVCAQLAGKDATYSSDVTLRSKPRAFGLIVTSGATQHPTPSAPLASALAACHVTVKKSVAIVGRGSDDSSQSTSDGAQQQQQEQNAILQMETSGVTSLICVCQADYSGLTEYAASQHYFPEWLVNHSDQNILNDSFSPAEKSAEIEVSSFPRQVPEAASYFMRALQSVDPGFCPCSSSLDFLFGQFTYWELMLVASGIQMAGPDLTPATFQSALQRTVFSNPPDPLDEGKVGFAGGGHTMVDDFIVAWWNSSARSPYGGDPAGSWCYADGGRRFTLGNFPKQSILPSTLATATCTN